MSYRVTDRGGVRLDRIDIEPEVDLRRHQADLTVVAMRLGVLLLVAGVWTLVALLISAAL